VTNVEEHLSEFLLLPVYLQTMQVTFLLLQCLCLQVLTLRRHFPASFHRLQLLCRHRCSKMRH